MQFSSAYEVGERKLNRSVNQNGSGQSHGIGYGVKEVVPFTHLEL